MTWQWVAVILGIFAMITLLFGYIIWTQMKLKIFEVMSLAPSSDLLALKLPTFEARPSEEQDTMVGKRWPEDFTGAGGEDASA